MILDRIYNPHFAVLVGQDIFNLAIKNWPDIRGDQHVVIFGSEYGVNPDFYESM